MGYAVRGMSVLGWAQLQKIHRPSRRKLSVEIPSNMDNDLRLTYLIEYSRGCRVRGKYCDSDIILWAEVSVSEREESAPHEDSYTPLSPFIL